MGVGDAVAEREVEVREKGIATEDAREEFGSGQFGGSSVFGFGGME